MSDHPRPTHLSRLLARCYPRELREQYAEDIARFIDDARRDPRNRNNPFSTISITLTLVKDALLSLVAALRGDTPPTLRARHNNHSFLSRFRELTMDTILQDIRFALRGFARRPGFTVVALLTLALGIGGTSAIFTLVNAVLLAPLPYPAPDQLVNIWGASPTGTQGLLSVPDLEDMRARNHAFVDIGIARSQSVNVTGGDRPDRVVGNFVTEPTLRLLGATPVAGRLFNAVETKVGAGEQVVVISYDTWQSRFGGRKDIVGQSMVLNGRPHVVIGVTSAAFRDPNQGEVWLPITSAPSHGWFARNNPSVWAIGRLKAGQTLAGGQRDLAAIAKELNAAQPGGNTGNTVALIDLRESLVGSSRFLLVVLFGAVGAVLLIVCVNIANLQLVRASTRAREMSVRAALGANRGRLISQVLVESVLLAVVGGALGVLVGQLAAKTLVAFTPNTFTLIGTVQVDARVLAFSFAVALVTGVLFGTPAALSGSRADLQSALRARNDSVSTRRFNVRNLLVVSELALCIVLLAVAGLFTRSLQRLQGVDTGFNAEHVLTAEFRLPSVKYSDSVKVRQFMDAALQNLRSTPGVVQAALVDAVPLSGNFGSLPYVAQNHAQPEPGKGPNTQITSASDGYFRAIGIRQLAGRDFNSNDVFGSEPVAIVNKVFADREWPGENAIGKTVRMLIQPEVTVRIIGVVGAIKQYTLTEADGPQMYVSRSQNAGIFTSVILRTAGDADAMANQLRAAIWAVDKDQPVWKIRTLQALVDRDLSRSKVSVGIISSFAILALLLGTVGVYGVMSFAVQQRTREMGIRLALGARSSQVLALVLRSGAEVVTVAIVVGVAGAFVAGRYVESKLYNVGAADPATMFGVPVVLAVVALVACWLPARRASRLDPAVTLRGE